MGGLGHRTHQRSRKPTLPCASLCDDSGASCRGPLERASIPACAVSASSLPTADVEGDGSPITLIWMSLSLNSRIIGLGSITGSSGTLSGGLCILKASLRRPRDHR